MKHLLLRRLSEFLAIEINAEQERLLNEFGRWLLEEAIPAGGLGPSESQRLEERHVGDSLLFAHLLPTDMRELRDIGSGVGLPGIPLAILHPETSVELVDRSGKRVDLARRAVRVLGLDNVSVVQGEIERISQPIRHLVSRASLSPERIGGLVEGLLLPGGSAVVGGSWEAPPTLDGWETVEIPATVLDQPVWLLIMRRQ